MDSVLHTMIMATVAFPTVIMASVLLYVYWVSPLIVHRRNLRNGLVGPKPSFPLGNLKEMSEKSSAMPSSSSIVGASDISHDILSKVFPHYSRWRKTFGNVFIYWLGTEPFLYVAEPEFLRQATAGQLDKSWGKPDVFKYDRKPMFGKGLIMVEGDLWANHRNIIAPAFSATNLNAMISKMVESTNKMVNDWNDQISSGNPEINVDVDIMRNAAEIIAKISFGISQDKAKKVYEKFLVLQNTLFKSERLVGVPFSKLLHLKNTLEATALGKEIDDQLLLSTVNSRRARQLGDHDGGQHDLLGLLLAANQLEGARPEKKKLTARELVDECKTFFFGGHETTGLALTWTMLLLAKHPEWQNILRDEVIEVCGEEQLDPTMLAKLTKMEWVLNEVLRLYPPAPNSQRQAREDIKVGNVTIPKGTNMWVDSVGMHHDPSLWGDDVNEFRPERFKDCRGGGCKHRLGFLPFGFGGRICIGRNLTRLEYKIVLCLVLREFSVAVSPNYKHSPEWVLTLRPAHGVPLTFQPIKKEK